MTNDQAHLPCTDIAIDLPVLMYLRRHCPGVETAQIPFPSLGTGSISVATTGAAAGRGGISNVPLWLEPGSSVSVAHNSVEIC